MKYNFEIDLQHFNTVKLACLLNFLDEMRQTMNTYYRFLNIGEEITNAIKNDDCTGLKIEVSYRDEIKPYVMHYGRS